MGETLPEGQAVFIERTAERTLRVAACLAASECSESITEEILSAAFSLVRRSVQDTVRITKGATSPKTNRQPLSLTDKVRARIELHGGRATSSQVLPYVGATASEVKALPGIMVTVERSGRTGRPATVFTLRDDSSDHTEQPKPVPTSRPAGAQRDVRRATVVQMDTYRTAPKQAPALAPAPVKRPEPVPDADPFRALL